MSRIVITGAGAICGSGHDPKSIVDELLAGHSAITTVESWDGTHWAKNKVAAVSDYNGGKLLGDRKLLKLVRRSDVFGIYVGAQAVAQAGLDEHREALDEQGQVNFADQTGCYVGSGGGAFEVNYDFFPLMAESGDSLPLFGKELSNVVNPMWLLRSLPNNVLCHVGIRHQLKGPNACITNHATSGLLSVIEGAWALRESDAERIVAIGHDAPIEPQTFNYLDSIGVIAQDALRPFDSRHDGCLLGEGAGCFVLEKQASAAARGAAIIGEYLGGAQTAEGEGLFSVRPDGDGVARTIRAALADAGLKPSDVGMIVAHGNGTVSSDVSEAHALKTVFGSVMPPVTSFKWAAGHLFAASGFLDMVVGLEAIRRQVVPGIAQLETVAAGCEGVNISANHQTPSSDILLVLCRGFAGTNAAVLLRGFA